MKAYVVELQERVSVLEDRLELYGTDGGGKRVRLPDSCDGIACRDATIEGLEARLAVLQEAFDDMHNAMLREYERAKSAEAQLAEAERAIEIHNDGCREACWSAGPKRCAPYTERGRNCPDCPEDFLIDYPRSTVSASGGAE